jgi:hypothetical protein
MTPATFSASPATKALRDLPDPLDTFLFLFLHVVIAKPLNAWCDVL